MSRRLNTGDIGHSGNFPKVPNTDPRVSGLPSASRVPPALKRLQTKPLFDDSWFLVYDGNPDAAKAYRRDLLRQNPGKTLPEVNLYIQTKRSAMEEERKKERLAVAKVKRDKERQSIVAKREQKAQKAQDKEVVAVCQQLKQILANYPSQTKALEKVVDEKSELFKEIHSKFVSQIREEQQRVDSIIQNDCSLRRSPEFLSKGRQSQLFENMDKIIAQFRKDMCAKMKEHIINKYSASTNPIIKNARENYPTIYKKYLPVLEHNMQRIKTGYNDLCHTDTTNNYFNEKFVSGLMDPIVMQMQNEIEAVTARPTRLGGKKKTHRGKTHRGKTRRGKTRRSKRGN
ncbi:MAG: hypothetical protein ACR2M6_01765 [Vampirovibrionia bacterium]